MILPFVMTFTKTVIMPNAMSVSILTFLSMFWQCITTEFVSFKILLNSHSCTIISLNHFEIFCMSKPNPNQGIEDRKGMGERNVIP